MNNAITHKLLLPPWYQLIYFNIKFQKFPHTLIHLSIPRPFFDYAVARKFFLFTRALLALTGKINFSLLSIWHSFLLPFYFLFDCFSLSSVKNWTLWNCFFFFFYFSFLVLNFTWATYKKLRPKRTGQTIKSSFNPNKLLSLKIFLFLFFLSFWI